LATEDLAADLGWLQAAAGRALRGPPERPLRNDALPQNVLVAPGPGGGGAPGDSIGSSRAGDPLWAVATLDFRPAGLVPEAFSAGYGAPPPEPQASVYELLMAAWRTRAELEGHGPWRWPPPAARLAHLRELPARLARLAGLLGVRG
jgi:hypothetical protein